MILKYEYIENERKFSYLILTNVVVSKNVMSFVFNIIIIFSTNYIYFLRNMKQGVRCGWVVYERSRVLVLFS